MDLKQAITPALLLDLSILKHNLREMAGKALRHDVALRPHIKTHKCPEIAQMQLDLGSKGITVATLVEAKMFAEAGIEDITHAFPLDPGKIPVALDLAEQTELRVTVDDLSVAAALEEAAGNRGQTVHAWLKVDCGYHRAGVDSESDYAMQLSRIMHEAAHIEFDGLLAHAGHVYWVRSMEELIGVANQERDTMIAFRERLAEEGIGPVLISIGSTPTMSIIDNLEGVDEIRPGNYAFHDWTQVCLGSCALEDCAVTVLATVVSRQPGSKHAVIDAGALTLSHDPGPTQIDRDGGRGRVLEAERMMSVHPALRVTAVSQEHGIIQGNKPEDLEGMEVGTTVRILPNHSCLAAAMFDEYLVVEGQEVVDRWRIQRARS
ncbi:alanine racemase [Candidatus Neomarinimicrobiota bacterium]